MSAHSRLAHHAALLVTTGTGGDPRNSGVFSLFHSPLCQAEGKLWLWLLAGLGSVAKCPRLLFFSSAKLQRGGCGSFVNAASLK